MTEEQIALIARTIFEDAVGATQWDNDFYAGERAGCFDTARKIAALVLIAEKDQQS